MALAAVTTNAAHELQVDDIQAVFCPGPKLPTRKKMLDCQEFTRLNPAGRPFGSSANEGIQRMFLRLGPNSPRLGFKLNLTRLAQTDSSSEQT